MPGDPNPTLAISSGNLSAPGKSLTLPVSVTDSAAGLQSVLMDINYDTDVFDQGNGDLALGALVAELAGNEAWSLTPNVDDAAGKVTVLLHSVEPLPGGIGDLLEVTYNVRSDAPSGLTQLDLADAETYLNGGALTITTLDGDVFIDATAPTVAAVKHNDGQLRPNQLTSLAFTLSEDVEASIEVTDLSMHNDTTDQYVDLSALAEGDFAYDHLTHIARWDLSRISFPPAYYTYTLNSASVTDLAGNELDGDGNGVGGDNYSDTLMVALGGDVNLDGSVNLADLVIMGHPNHCGQGGMTWIEGDLNFDSNVNMADLIILGDPSNWDKSLI